MRVEEIDSLLPPGRAEIKLRAGQKQLDDIQISGDHVDRSGGVQRKPDFGAGVVLNTGRSRGGEVRRRVHSIGNGYNVSNEAMLV